MTTPISRRLSNGLDLIVEPMPGVRSAGLCWLLPAGSAAEPADLEGLGAMWSELVFRGAGDRDARRHADAMDSLGVRRDADTETYFFRFEGVMLGERVLDALPLFIDMARRPGFHEADVEPVRDLCVQAVESLADDPHERVMILAKARHAPAPLNRSGMGRIETLERITRDDIARHWATRVRPEGAAIAVAGAVDPDAVAARLEELFAGWAGSAPEWDITSDAERGRVHEDDDTNQVHIAVLHDAPKESHADARLERVLASVLSGGMSSRLFTEVREKRGLVYSVNARYAGSRDFGRVAAYAGTTPERARETLDVLLAELRRLTADGEAGGVTESEFRRAVTGLKSSLVMSGESTGARASALASDWFRLGRPRTLAERLAEFDAITLDEVNSYAARRTLGELTVASIGPAGSA